MWIDPLTGTFFHRLQQFFDQLIGPKNQVLAIENAEKLADSLKER